MTKLPIALALAAAFSISTLAAPLGAEAASKKRDACGDASFDDAALAATSSRPTISGEASTARTVQLVIRAEGSDKVKFRSKVIKVRDDEWSVRVPKKLAKGEYDVELYCPRAQKGTAIATGTLVIGGSSKEKPAKSKSAEKADTTVTVTSIPLLTGGAAAAGEATPVSYLQVRNTGKEAARVTGFWVDQRGTAPASAIASFTAVDGTGASRVTTDTTIAKDGSAFVKTDVTIPAGGFSLFTIKSNLAGSLGSSVGSTLQVVVTGVESDAKVGGKFPIAGTTWVLR